MHDRCGQLALVAECPDTLHRSHSDRCASDVRRLTIGPIPRTEFSDFIRRRFESTGKRIDERTAATAADAALEGANPMSMNGYKVQIAKTAVKRAILQAGGIKTA